MKEGLEEKLDLYLNPRYIPERDPLMLQAVQAYIDENGEGK